MAFSCAWWLGRVWLAVGLVLALTAALLMGSPAPVGAVAGYGDVSEGSWYTDAVQWSVDNAITGITGVSFGPDTPVSRGETAVWIYNMENQPDARVSHSFTDVTDASQDDAISWMANTGITTGTSPTTFAPDETLRRAQAATFLHRLAGEPSAPPHNFSDIVAGWQQDSVSWMAHTGITTGTSPTTFAPEGTLTRAELVTFLYRYQGKPDATEDPADSDQASDTEPGATEPEPDIPSGSVATDRAALVALYHATDGPNWDVSGNWLTDEPLWTWYGVEIWGGRVVRLNFGERWGPRGEPLGSGNNLSGPIPPEIGNLTSLDYLNLEGNNLSGPIPPEIGNLTSLDYLNLEGNNLSGPIPSEIGNLANLRELILDHNALTGSIPSEIGNLIDLVGLGLMSNNLAGGPIPVEFATLGSLERLRLDVEQCAPSGLRSFLRERRLDILPCTASEVRLLPGALLREDSEGLALALDEDLQNPTSVTVSDPAVVTAAVQNGWLVLTPEGRGEADIVIVPSGGGLPATATVVVRAAVGTFGIDIVMEQPVTDIYAETMTAAADRWSLVLDGTQWEGRDARQYCDRWEREVPVAASGNELVIWAERESDPSYSAGATGWACQRREGPDTEPSHYYPVAGIVTTNARVPHFSGDVGIMRHEIGHVLGLTSLFPPATGLVTEDWKYFVGPRAVAAFREGGGDPDLRGIPLDGPHWGYGVNGPEVMLDPRGGVDGLSVAALADAGYKVDMSKVIPWYQRE